MKLTAQRYQLALTVETVIFMNKDSIHLDLYVQ